MVSAVCPNCQILLVEATTNLDSDLYAAEDTAAARSGANVISNSWGGDESSDETADDVHFNHPGIAITASSGDSGYGVAYPAASPLRDRGRRHVADDRGGGSARLDRDRVERRRQRLQRVRRKPTWQTDAGCARRTVADVSAVADPNTGVAVSFGEPAGSSSAARAPRRRSSPASTRSPATRRA